MKRVPLNGTEGGSVLFSTIHRSRLADGLRPLQEYFLPLVAALRSGRCAFVDPAQKAYGTRPVNSAEELA